MKVLVTGGAGFIGSHLVSALLDGGEDVVVLDNFKRAVAGPPPGEVECHRGDVRDVEVVRRSLQGVSRVFHLAAQSNVLGAVSDVAYSFTTNVTGTFNVLLAARDAGIERIVFSSSREVYGEVEDLPVAEDRPLNAKNAYGASKVAGEVYCRTFERSFGLDVSVLRLANVYGPGDQGRVIPLWLDAARRGEPLRLYGGDQVIDFVPVEVVVEGLRRAMDRSLGGQPINVGSGRGTVLRDLARHIAGLPGFSCAIDTQPARDVEVTRFVADVTKMRYVLQVDPPRDPLERLSNLAHDS